MTYWTAGWHALFRALEGLKDDQLSDIVYIRNEGHTVHEAIDRQLAHYAYHIGQIVFICKMMTPQNWKSLTIPKGGSETFNAKKFNTGPRRGHYTDEVQDS